MESRIIVNIQEIDKLFEDEDEDEDENLHDEGQDALK